MVSTQEQSAVTEGRARGPAAAVLTAALLGVLAWIVPIALRLTGAGTGQWKWRDDAVITLSHALNLAEFGSIGVSPGGDRVEGFSAPLQFILAALTFAISPIGYEIFLDAMVWGCAALTGAAFSLTIWSIARRTSYSAWHATTWAGIGTLLVGTSVAASWTATGWLVSGMENPLIVLLGAVVILVAVAPFRRLATPILLGVSIALLGLTRIEMPALLAPVLFSAALYVAHAARPRSWRTPVTIAIAVPAITWALVTTARFVYFRELLPNTAVVQGKASGTISFAILLAGSAAFVLAVVLITRSQRPQRVQQVLWASVAGIGALVLAVMVAMTLLGKDPIIAGYWFPDPGYVAILAMLVLASSAMFAVARVESKPWTADAVLAAVAFTPLLQFLAMGPARLDVFRIASMAVPFLAVLLVGGLVRLSQRSRWILVAFVGAFVVVVFIVGLRDPVRGLCCTISPSESQILAVADDVRSRDLGGTALPIVANPDLGKLSFAKRAIIVDLGWLGDPLLARIHRDRPELLATYLNKVAMPDVVEMHAGWPCTYQEWFASSEFSQAWTLTSGTSPPPVPGDGCPPLDARGIWVRTDAAAEYALTRDIAAASDPASVVKAAIDDCAAQEGDQWRCESVRRSVTRNAQLLRDRGTLDSVLDALAQSPSATLDIPLVQRGPGWAATAAAAFYALSGGQ